MISNQNIYSLVFASFNLSIAVSEAKVSLLPEEFRMERRDLGVEFDRTTQGWSPTQQNQVAAFTHQGFLTELNCSKSSKGYRDNQN